MLFRSEKSITATKSSAMSNVRGIAHEAASAIVTKLTGAAPSQETVASAVDDAIKR